MCGIIAVLRRPGRRPPPALGDLAEHVDAAEAILVGLVAGGVPDAGPILDAADHLERVDAALRGSPGVVALLTNRSRAATLSQRVELVRNLLERVDALVDVRAGELGPGVEEINAAMVRARDAAWAVARDRLPTAGAVADLAGPDAGVAAIEAFTAVQIALSAIDRLEVRGRDSAGLHLLVRDHGLDLDDPTLGIERRADRLFGSRAVRTPDGLLSVVYKAAAEIGELGDNTAVIRAAIRADDLLRRALVSDAARVTVLGHTRWASVGVISEANAHPLNHEDESGATAPYVVGALNGDVDNHLDLRVLESLHVAPEITTDAKVIPAVVSRRIADGLSVVDAFRASASSLEGSVAVAANAAAAPGQLLLALRGSGQALYVGLAEDEFIVASEPYGVVEETDVYLRLDGERLSASAPAAGPGQIVVLDVEGAGTIAGIRRYAYDGTELPVDADELAFAQITTRDIDRGDAPHFLLKEISEAPSSFRKTLRGRIVERDGLLDVELGEDAFPAAIRSRIASGAIRRVDVIGQGTAAVAGSAFANTLEDLTDGAVAVHAVTATELSGFALREDMSDALVVAISQSGTTTDTNRTVDLVRGRGASVVSIVNRRNSDLTDKSDGVIYTSDGRDVEMSVASTKAFYAQVAAGQLLASAIARELGTQSPTDRHELLSALREVPELLHRVLERRPSIASAARRYAPSRRSWAVVGNGPNRVAAEEVRIKLSELCYKSIACDVTEDKKHIDLSSEPLVLVCAAGLTGSNADDVAKELAIYRAHKAAPIAIVTEGDRRFDIALETIEVPAAPAGLAFVLSAMAGHLFGYEAALAIDASARPLREARVALEAAVSARGGDLTMEDLSVGLVTHAARFFDELRAGGYDGSLEAGTAVRAASLLRFGAGLVPLEFYELEHGSIGTPVRLAEDLLAALTKAVEELTRPIDAIKHQAKTVTVGISRSDETFVRVPLVAAALESGAPRDGLSYRTMRTLVALDGAVAEVIGFTRYRIEGDVSGDTASAHVVDKGGIALDIVSRTDRDSRLRGTKHLAALEREVWAARGRSDGRTVVYIPEVKAGQTIGLTLLHVRFHDHMEPGVARSVLQGYRNRWSALKDAVTEVEPVFDESVLAEIDVAELLTRPVFELAERWHRP